MRKGEKSTITLQPKYGFRKANIDTLNEFFPGSQIDIEKMRKSTVIYEIEVIDFLRIYDISGNKTMMKYIITPGEGLIKPSESDLVIFNIKFKVSDSSNTFSEILFEKTKEELTLNKNNFSDWEMTIFKSFKKGESSSIEISPKIFIINQEGYARDKLSNFIQNFTDNKRLFIEIELIRFIKEFSVLNYKGVDYTMKTVSKGLGYVCPWKNSLIKLSVSIFIDDSLFYSDYNESIAEVVKSMKDIKHKIKEIKNYERNLQFIVNDLVKMNGNIYDPLMQNIPKIFFSEIIPKMKLLETISVTFKDKISFLCLPNNKEITNENEIKDYKFVITLINFEERGSPFNRAISESTQLKNILIYKTRANFFFSQGLLNKAKLINKYLVDEYLKQVNLDRGVNKLTKNQIDFNEITLRTNSNYVGTESNLNEEMKKINSNLILILFRKGKFSKSLDYIHIYYTLFDTQRLDEKVLYFHFKSLKNLNKTELSIEILCKLIDLFPNSKSVSEYKNERENLLKIITQNEKNKNNLIKKMFKFD